VAWDLDGSTQYFDCIMPTAVKNAAGGPFTMAAFIDLDAATDGAPICNMSGSSVFQVLEIFSSLNYGTSAGTRNGPNVTTLTPSAVGNPYIMIISKNTGNVAPEYTVIPWTSGAPGTPVSGTITGGGATLGDGVAPGASGFIRCGQYGTVTAERINGRIIALAQYTEYKDSTERATLDSWNDWLDTGGPGAALAWAMEFTALTSRTDASGNGGNESARNGTTPYTLVADPANFFPSGGSAVSVADVPNGLRLRSGYEALSGGLGVADSPAGLRLRSPEGSGVQFGVATTDSPRGFRLRSAIESVSTGILISDAPNGLRWRSRTADTVVTGTAVADNPAGLRWRSGSDSISIGVGIADVPTGLRWRSGADSVSLSVTVVDSISGLRFRSGYEVVVIGGGAVDVADPLAFGFRLRSVGGTAVLGHAIADVPNGWRLRSGADSVTVGGSTIVDQPFGFRWRSGRSSVSIAVGATIYAPVGIVRISGGVATVEIEAPTVASQLNGTVRRFRA
jgi:hypothetical protein